MMAEVTDDAVKEFKLAREKYRELQVKLAEAGVKGVLDPADLVGTSCTPGELLQREVTDDTVQEFKLAKEKYQALYAKLADLGVKGVLDPIDLLAVGCNAGDISCHGGSTDTPVQDLGRPIRVQLTP